MQEKGDIKYVHKTDTKRKGGSANTDKADKGVRGGLDPPPFFADIISEQPLRYNTFFFYIITWFFLVICLLLSPLLTLPFPFLSYIFLC